MEHLQSHIQKKGNYKFVIFIFLILYHCALFYSLNFESVNISDSQEYINSSINYKNNNNFYSGEQGEKTDFRLYTKRTPLYPLILFGFNKLNLSLNLVYILQIFIGLLNILIAIKLMQFLSKHEKIPVGLFSFFLLLTPSQVIYSLVVMADIWLQLFVTICFWSFAEFIKTKHSYWLVLLIFSTTLAALTKPVFLVFSLIISIASLYYFIVKSRHKILFLVSLIPLLSWYIVCNQNQKNTGIFHYSSIGYINLLHYNTNLFLNKTVGKEKTEKLLLPLMIVPETKEDFANNYNQVKKVCITEILKQPIGYAIYHLKGVLYFFVDPGRYDIYNFLRIEKTNSDGFLHNGLKIEKLKSVYKNNPLIFWFLLLIFLVNIIKMVGFIGFIIHERRNIIMLFGAGIVLYIALLTGPLGASRFALPAQLIMASYASLFYYSKMRRRHRLKANLII